jgi:hypothetical protein
MGAHTGNVIHGDIGGLRRKDCTVVGDAVNTAARLERFSDVDSLLISHATFIAPARSPATSCLSAPRSSVDARSSSGSTSTELRPSYASFPESLLVSTLVPLGVSRAMYGHPARMSLQITSGSEEQSNGSHYQRADFPAHVPGGGRRGRRAIHHPLHAIGADGGTARATASTSALSARAGRVAA